MRIKTAHHTFSSQNDRQTICEKLSKPTLAASARGGIRRDVVESHPSLARRACVPRM